MRMRSRAHVQMDVIVLQYLLLIEISCRTDVRPIAGRICGWEPVMRRLVA